MPREHSTLELRVSLKSPRHNLRRVPMPCVLPRLHLARLRLLTLLLIMVACGGTARRCVLHERKQTFQLAWLPGIFFPVASRQ